MNKIMMEIIETYRKEHKLTVTELVEDITSNRSYYRYMSGEADIPLSVLFAILEKMKYSSMSFVYHCVNLFTKHSENEGYISSALLDGLHDKLNYHYSFFKDEKDQKMDEYLNGGIIEQVKTDLLNHTLTPKLSSYVLASIHYLTKKRSDYLTGQITLEEYKSIFIKFYLEEFHNVKEKNDAVFYLAEYFSLYKDEQDFDIPSYLEMITNESFNLEGTTGVIIPSIYVLDALSMYEIKTHFELYQRHLDFISSHGRHAAFPGVLEHIYRHEANRYFILENKKEFYLNIIKYYSIIKLRTDELSLKKVLMRLTKDYGFTSFEQLIKEAMTYIL
jgi:transcriptional regulator with XRE-family HTH domain